MFKADLPGHNISNNYKVRHTIPVAVSTHQNIARMKIASFGPFKFSPSCTFSNDSERSPVCGMISVWVVSVIDHQEHGLAERLSAANVIVIGKRLKHLRD